MDRLPRHGERIPLCASVAEPRHWFRVEREWGAALISWKRALAAAVGPDSPAVKTSVLLGLLEQCEATVEIGKSGGSFSVAPECPWAGWRAELWLPGENARAFMAAARLLAEVDRG